MISIEKQFGKFNQIGAINEGVYCMHLCFPNPLRLEELIETLQAIEKDARERGCVGDLCFYYTYGELSVEGITTDYKGKKEGRPTDNAFAMAVQKCGQVRGVVCYSRDCEWRKECKDYVKQRRKYET